MTADSGLTDGDDVELLIFALFAAIAWYWYEANLAKQKAMASARRACHRHGQQLLDETVVLAAIRPRRDRDGRVRWLRHYRFEFSDEGESRRHGDITLLGRRVTGLTLALAEHTLHEQEDVSGTSHYH